MQPATSRIVRSCSRRSDERAYIAAWVLARSIAMRRTVRMKDSISGRGVRTRARHPLTPASAQQTPSLKLTHYPHRIELQGSLSLASGRLLRVRVIMDDEAVPGLRVVYDAVVGDTVRVGTTRTALPASSFVGRDKEVRALLSAICRPGVITLTGASGIGKTRLASELLNRVAGRQSLDGYRGPAVAPLFVSLPDDCNGDAILKAVAAEREARLLDDGTWQGTEALPELLILDNAGFGERTGPAIEFLASDSPECRLVVTSGGPLGIPGEQVLRLGPLTAGAGTNNPAVRLFLDRAMSASALFREDEADLTVIGELCDVLDGLPLAIEIAASRVAAYPPEALLSQLQSRMGLELLTRSAPHGPDRHRSVRAALEWSYRLLSPNSRCVLTALSVFTASFSADGAAAVVSPVEEGEAFEILSTLVDYHLIEPVTTGPAVGRFRLLQLVRRFADEQLAGSGRSDQVELLRAAYVCGLARRAAAAFDRHDQAAALGVLEHEWAEVSAVTDRLLANGSGAAALQVAVDCAPYLLRMGYDATAHARLERLIERARRGENQSAVLTRALLWSAVLTRLMAENRPSPDWINARLAEGIQRARDSQDRNALLMGLEFTVLCAAVTGDAAAVPAAVAEGLAMTSDGTDEGWLARFEGLACMVRNLVGDREGAAEFGQAAVSRALRRDDHAALLRAALAVMGLPDATDLPAYRILPSFDELIVVCRESRDRHSEQFLLVVEASRRLVTGDHEGASALSADQLALLLARGESGTLGLGFANSVLATVAAHRKDYDLAAQLHGSIERLGPAVTHAATPGKRQAYIEAMAATRVALGEIRWDAQRRLGASSTPAGAARLGITYARSVAPRPDATVDEPPPAQIRLRPSELEVLRAMVAGKTNKEIARDLSLSPKTVMHYLSAIYKRIGVRGRAAATAWAFRNGVLDDR
jgi:predicted ATPase/DNA-binding CsgD family transcriptional regulator